MIPQDFNHYPTKPEPAGDPQELKPICWWL